MTHVDGPSPRSSTARAAVVTGGARGLVRAIADRLLADGQRVTVFDVSPPNEPEPRWQWLECDVTDADEVQRSLDTVVQRHGGRIWAESGPGQGARFHFTLPDRPA